MSSIKTRKGEYIRLKNIHEKEKESQSYNIDRYESPPFTTTATTVSTILHRIQAFRLPSADEYHCIFCTSSEDVAFDCPFY
jgi:arginine repressor